MRTKRNGKKSRFFGDMSDPKPRVGETAWIYKCEFEANDVQESHLDLVFEGLDTFCTLYLVSLFHFQVAIMPNCPAGRRRDPRLRQHVCRPSHTN